MANKPKRIDLTPEELKALLKRVETVVSKEDYEKIKAMAETIEALSNLAGEKASTIKRLLKMLFGQTSETKKNVLGDPGDDQNDDEKNGQINTADESKPQDPEGPKKKKRPWSKRRICLHRGKKGHSES